MRLVVFWRFSVRGIRAGLNQPLVLGRQLGRQALTLSLPSGVFKRGRQVSPPWWPRSHSTPFNRDSLRECDVPVFFGCGDPTGEHEEVRARILGWLFPDIHIRRFAGIHHFVSRREIYTTARSVPA